MVLHYAEDPAAALAEAARVLRPGGVLLVADLAPHGTAEVLGRFAHRWPGFDDSELAGWLGQAGCALAARQDIPGRLPVRVWRAEKLPADALTHA
jgi:ArsR family transcriptional regulator